MTDIKRNVLYATAAIVLALCGYSFGFERGRKDGYGDAFITHQKRITSWLAEKSEPFILRSSLIGYFRIHDDGNILQGYPHHDFDVRDGKEQ